MLIMFEGVMFEGAMVEQMLGQCLKGRGQYLDSFLTARSAASYFGANGTGFGVSLKWILSLYI